MPREFPLKSNEMLGFMPLFTVKFDCAGHSLRQWNDCVKHAARIFHDDVHHQMDTFSTLLTICAGNSPVTGEFPAHIGQWCRALMFSLMCTWINSWANNGEAGDLRLHRAHYYVTVVHWVHFLSTRPQTIVWTNVDQVPWLYTASPWVSQLW